MADQSNNVESNVEDRPLDDKTQNLLTELKQSIEDLEAGHGSRIIVEDLAGRVEERLANGGQDPDDDDDTLAEDIMENAVAFEVDHPQAADLLRRIIDSLSGMGL